MPPSWEEVGPSLPGLHTAFEPGDTVTRMKDITGVYASSVMSILHGDLHYNSKGKLKHCKS